MDTAPSPSPPLYDEIPDRRHRFVSYVGWGFLTGTACGAALYSVRGFRSSPAGGRLAGAAHAALANAPRAGGLIGVCSAFFCAFEGAMALARRRDDPWNSVVAGAAALGLLHAPLGGRTAAASALLGAAVEVVIHGAGWVADEWDDRFSSDPPARTRPVPGTLAPAVTPAPIRTESPLSWLRMSSTPAPLPSITSKQDHEVLDLSRKFLLEKMREGFHSPSSVKYGFSSVHSGGPI